MLTVRQVRTGDEVRRLAVIKRPVGNAIFFLAALAGAAAVVAAAGRGGGEDGALGIAIALAVMIGGTVCIQRLGRVRVLIGFNPDGLWTPTSGWVAWDRVRHIELRQRSNLVTGRHHTLWVAYAPIPEAGGEEADDVWVDARPGLRQWRILAVVEEMDRCWKAAVKQPR